MLEPTCMQDSGCDKAALGDAGKNFQVATAAEAVYDCSTVLTQPMTASDMQHFRVGIASYDNLHTKPSLLG